jgi:hypothetical protein
MIKVSDEKKSNLTGYLFCSTCTVHCTQYIKKTRSKGAKANQNKKMNINKIYLHKLMVLTSTTRLIEDVTHENIFSC